MKLKSLLAMDIGGGTRDILFWRSDQPIENAVKMAVPSPTQVLAVKVRRARENKRPVHLSGWLMGGGAMQRALTEHIKAGLSVSATPQAAASVADDLDRVRALGVRITEQAPPGALRLYTSDLDLVAFRQAMGLFEIEEPQRLAVAVCDHGYAPHASNRKFRFAQWESFLADGGRLTSLMTDRVPPHLTRLAAIKEQAPGALVMDTAAAALWGALQDPEVSRLAGEPLCVVNLGNMHTVGFLMAGRKVFGVYEHHTSCLDTVTLADHINRFVAGRITDQEVFNTRGHGCARLESAPAQTSTPVVITGPQRRLAQGLPWRTAVPFGDVMLSGCFGLVAAARRFLDETEDKALA